MAEFVVVISDRAKADIAEIVRYLVPRAGRPVAHSYADEIIDYCLGFSLFPNRGTVMSSKHNMRSVGFNRQATILFRVDHRQVTILRIFHRGSNVELEEI